MIYHFSLVYLTYINNIFKKLKSNIKRKKYFLSRSQNSNDV